MDLLSITVIDPEDTIVVSILKHSRACSIHFRTNTFKEYYYSFLLSPAVGGGNTDKK